VVGKASARNVYRVETGSARGMDCGRKERKERFPSFFGYFLFGQCQKVFCSCSCVRILVRKAVYRTPLTGQAVRDAHHNKFGYAVQRKAIRERLPKHIADFCKQAAANAPCLLSQKLPFWKTSATKSILKERQLHRLMPRSHF